MASKFPTERGEKVKLRTRKGHDMTWSCDKHGEPIKLYCVQHGISVCQVCAVKSHQKPCELDDIEDVIFERRGKLEEKQPQIEKMKLLLRKVESEIEAVATSSEKHFGTVTEDLQATFLDKLKGIGEKHVTLVQKINNEANDEIRLINEKREQRIESSYVEREKEENVIKVKEAKVLSDLKGISEIVSKKINDLTCKIRHAINTMKNIESSITRINKHDETLVNEAPQVLASIDEQLGLNVHQDVSDSLERMQDEIKRVAFAEGVIGGEFYGRVDGFIGKWKLVQSIHIPDNVKYPRMRALISEGVVCLLGKEAMHIININKGHIEEVIHGLNSRDIASCAAIDGNVIVCGTRKLVTLYDRQLKATRGISIPGNELSSGTYVDVDRDGMILAAQYGQSHIYVINPLDSKIVRTITMERKMIRGEIQALSSGDIVVNTGIADFTVISRSGEEKAAIHSDDWAWSWCYVDKLTDALYILQRQGRERPQKIAVVDQVSRDGILQASGIVEFERSRRTFSATPSCVSTPLGNLVCCDGNNLLVYKKDFHV
ncbi:uncharacterized protein LOC121416915 [Lytechinus variegatus]|uniref:uncharacterized protein LOC121416915 n=1 Tax=Lytechinus variegatus TaxID=7654 RepID=UPI001BB17BC3|nr:uncharacterized protein LOC121416915 [Lytechinus variegatus]